MSKLIKAISKKQNKTARTHNDAVSNESTLNSCLDLFGKINAFRDSPNGEIIRYFTKALSEDALKTMKILFYSRDIRGGQGERKTFRTIIKYLGKHHPDLIRKNLHLIPEFGRWDDLFALDDTKVWKDVLDLIKKQILQDVENIDSDNISLLGKWLPSCNTSSKKTVKLGHKIRIALNQTPREYRKMLSALREKIRIVESKMCANEWSSIDYSEVPSRASLIYRNAFKKHDEARYEQFLEDVKSNKKKINTSTLYPYDIVRPILNRQILEPDDTLDVQWNNLPNYVEPFNGIVVCDTSGSMYGVGFYRQHRGTISATPIEVAISLAMYIAERNEGPFKDKFITFSESPELQSIKGKNIFEKVKNLSTAHWDMNTNIQAVFNLILSVAVSESLAQEDLPERIFIVSDMQFDYAARGKTNLEVIKEKYEKAGYEMPQLIFWNVNSYSDVPVTVDDKGTCLVSGCSPVILKSVLAGDIVNPVDVMNKTIEVERYSVVQV